MKKDGSFSGEQNGLPAPEENLGYPGHDCTAIAGANCNCPAPQQPEECACGGEIKEAATHTKEHCKAVNKVPSIKEQVEQPEVGSVLEGKALGIALAMVKHIEWKEERYDGPWLEEQILDLLASQKAQEAERVREELEKILHTYWTNPFTGYNCGRHLKLKGALMDLLAALHQDT